jgi:hypothetical protein
VAQRKENSWKAMSKKGTCIFCSLRKKMSKEHVFPAWLEDFVPVLKQTHGAFAIAWNQEKKEFQKILEKKHGSPSTKITVRVVCRDCNSEWMSRLENAAKPSLIKLIQGEKCTISSDEQRTIATWIAKTVMTADYRFPDGGTASEMERSLLKTLLEPPGGWYVSIADYQGKRWRDGGLFRQSFTTDGPRKTKLHIRTTCFGLGRFFAHTIIVPSVVQILPYFEDKSSLRRLWPDLHRDLIWPPEKYLEDPDANYVIGTAARAFAEPEPHDLAGLAQQQVMSE